MNLLIENLPFLLDGAMVALSLLAVVLTLGCAIGVTIALLQIYGPLPLKVAVGLYERIFRGIPPVVLLLLVYHGGSEYVSLSPFWSAGVALGLSSGAYQSQIFRGAILNVPVGQMLAGRAMGMSKWQAVRWVILPSAARHTILPWGNEFSSQLKATSLAYVIGVVELTRQAKYIISSTQGNVLLVFAAVALTYFLMNRFGNWAFARLNKAISIPGMSTAT
ncbi:ABC transporter permease subunit [Pseudomonas sp. NPDC008258]|uniref:amino acid ABC transporter permease n=1 Tax=Pseudomonas sp. NPDC008258 TaxID=3364418 RepID=UPI0036E6B81F